MSVPAGDDPAPVRKDVRVSLETGGTPVVSIDGIRDEQPQIGSAGYLTGEKGEPHGSASHIQRRHGNRTARNERRPEIGAGWAS